MRRWVMVLSLAVATVPAVVLAVAPAAGAREVGVPRPVYETNRFADPSVTFTADGLVGVSTGAFVTRATAPGPSGPWTMIDAALPRLPSWAISEAAWAADIHKVGKRWLLYYSVPVAGVDADDRCIGVARSDSPTGVFRPVGQRPLVCPKKFLTPRAHDVVHGARRDGLPVAGVIDPSLFVDTDGSLSLLYRTQDEPSSIRVLPLRKNGVRPRTMDGEPAKSRELTRSSGTAENPVLLKRQGEYLLFTSNDSYANCGYNTQWRRSSTVEGLTTAKTHRLLTSSTTGICGPGGLDVLTRKGPPLVFFHGWLCAAGSEPPYPRCPANFELARDRDLGPRRAMFAARLRFTPKGRPKLDRYFSPVPQPPPPPGAATP